jgi:hypothetical protein
MRYFKIGEGADHKLVKLYPRDMVTNTDRFDYIIGDRCFLGVNCDFNTFFLEHNIRKEISEQKYNFHFSLVKVNAITWFEYIEMLKNVNFFNITFL